MQWQSSRVLAAAVALVLVAGPAAGQTVSELRREIDALKARLDAQQKEIDALKAQRPGAVAPPKLEDITLTLDSAPVRGRAASRVLLVEVSDFECPFCGRYSRQTGPLLEKDYVASGKVRHVFVNFPLGTHPNAERAAEAGLCAEEQGRFWELHAGMFLNQGRLAARFLPELALSAGLNVNRFDACLQSGEKRAHVASDVAMARRAGVTATPTFFVGLEDPVTGAVTVVERIVGAKPYAVFRQALDAALNRR